MANTRLSSDCSSVFSPINSDISLNDGSAFSFGSLDTPDSKDPLKTRKETYLESNLVAFTKNVAKPHTSTLNKASNKGININEEKEEIFKNTYEQLKQSMDDLCCSASTVSNTPFATSSGALKDSQVSETISLEVKKDKEKLTKSSKAKKLHSTFKIQKSEKAHENKAEGNSAKIRERKSNSSNKNFLKSKDTDTHINTEKIKYQKQCKKQTIKPIPLSQNCESVDACSAEGLKRNVLPKRCTERAASIQANIENKGLSLEMSIQIAVGMEFNKLHSFVLDQNLGLYKEICRLQEASRQQKATNESLFSIIEDLLEANKKLISKCK